MLKALVKVMISSPTPEAISKNSTISIGKNCFIMDGANIHPHVQVGDNTFVWSGALQPPLSRKQNCWITSNANIASDVIVGLNSFVGINATITPGVEIADLSFIGANALITKNTQRESVYIVPSTTKSRISSDSFWKLFS